LPAYALVVVSDILKAQKRWAKAEELLEESLDTALQVFEQNTVLVLYPMQSLEEVYEQTGKLVELEKLRVRKREFISSQETDNT
jgi:hypothetical protein